MLVLNKNGRRWLFSKVICVRSGIVQYVDLIEDKKVAQVLWWENSLWDVLLDKTIFEHDEESFLLRGTLINDTVSQLFYKSKKNKIS